MSAALVRTALADLCSRCDSFPRCAPLTDRREKSPVSYYHRTPLTETRASRWASTRSTSPQWPIMDECTCLQFVQRESGHDEKLQIHGRQQRRGLRVVRVHRGCRHLSHHPVQPHGRLRRPVGRFGHEEHLRRAGQGRRDAVRGRCRGRGPRLAGRRCPDHHLHGLPGPAADDPQHVQDRR